MLSLDDGAGFTPLGSLAKDNSLELGAPAQLANMGIGMGFGVEQEQASTKSDDRVQCGADELPAKLRGESGQSACAPVNALRQPQELSPQNYSCPNGQKLIDVWDPEDGKWSPRCMVVQEAKAATRVVAWERKVPRLHGTFGEKVVQHVLNYFRAFCSSQRGELQIDEKVGMFRGRKRPYYHCRCFIEVPGAAPEYQQGQQGQEQVQAEEAQPEVQAQPATPAHPMTQAQPSAVTPSIPAAVTPGTMVVPGPAVDQGDAHPVTTAQPVELPKVQAKPLPQEAVPAMPVDLPRTRLACPNGTKLMYPGTPQQQCVPMSSVVAQAVQAGMQAAGQARTEKERPKVIAKAVTEAVKATKMAAGSPVTAARVAGAEAGEAVREAIEGRPVLPGQEASIVRAVLDSLFRDVVKAPSARVVSGKMVLGCPAGYEKVKLTSGALKCVRTPKAVKRKIKGIAAKRTVVKARPRHPVVQAMSR